MTSATQLAATLMSLAGATISVGDDLLEINPYPKGDPFYSDEFDSLEDCIGQTSVDYRFDFDRPEDSAALQAANAIRQSCGPEVAALRALVLPFERSDDPSAVIGELDQFLVAPYFDAERLNGAPNTRLVRPDDVVGTSRLLPEHRMTYLPSAAGFKPGEMVAVARFDAWDGPHVISPFDQQFLYSGSIGGWRYSYSGAYGSWSGTIVAGAESARIECRQDDHWSRNPNQNCSIHINDKMRPLRGDRLLRAIGRGAPFKITGFCNPGHVDLSDMRFRPEAAPELQNAREGKITLDDGPPILLPDEGCLPDRNGILLSRILKARSIRTTFIPRFDTRTRVRTGSPAILKPALELAAYLHRLTFNAGAAAAMRTNQQNLRSRAHPFSLMDAVSQRPEWKGTIRCLRRALTSAAQTMEGALSGPCKTWLADLDWHVLDLKSDRPVAIDIPAEAAAGNADLQEVRKQLFVGARSNAVATGFDGIEVEGTVTGRRGKIGVAVDLPPGRSHDLQEYGYAIDGDRAFALVPSTRQQAASYQKSYLRSITIRCDAKNRRVCQISIPTDDGAGAFVIRSEGPWHDAELCVRYPDMNASTWKLAGYVHDDEQFSFDANACITDRTAEAIRKLAWGYGLWLVQPDEKERDYGKAMNRDDLDFALALAGYLTDRLRTTTAP